MKKMIRLFLIVLLITGTFVSNSQTVRNRVKIGEVIDAARRQTLVDSLVYNSYLSVKSYFAGAYETYPTVPRGILEAVSYYYTRFVFIPFDRRYTGAVEDIPKTYGLMGLTLDGKGVFRDNIKVVSDLSGIPLSDILENPQSGVLAFAAAFAELQRRVGVFSNCMKDYIPILVQLSELPSHDGKWDSFAIQSYLYSIFEFLSDTSSCKRYGLPERNIDMEEIFGNVLDLLRAPRVCIGRDVSRGETDYDLALWQPAGQCNYTEMQSRNISAITIHYTSGTYAGSIAWFQNCSYNGVGARASAHYIIRSSDGQITQMVREKDKAWHVRTENGYTIGIEHEAYGNVQNFFTSAMYNSSASLVRDICTRYNINPHRTFYRDTLDDGTCLNNGVHSLGGENACTKIRGHQHFPNQTHTDPGPYWDWNYYYKLLNPDTKILKYFTQSGILTDSGGENGNYGCDERSLYLIEVPDAKRIILDFEQFRLEKDYDFLWIYDGNTVYSPLLGRWNTVSPGTIVSSGNSILLEFRSDCATADSGWVVRWNTELDTIVDIENNPPVTEIKYDESKWQTKDFQVAFVDADDYGLNQRFYQVMEHNGLEWSAKGNRGFLCSNFDQQLDKTDWEIVSGNWKMLVHRLEQTDKSSDNAVIALPFNPTLSDGYLYDIYANVLECDGSNYKFGISFCMDSKSAPQNGYWLEIVPSEKKMILCRMKNGIKTVMKIISGITTNINQSYLYRIYHDRKTGEVKVFRHDNLLLSVKDALPPEITNGYFMLWTNKCRIAFDNLRAYRSRSDNVIVTVGAENDNDVSYQAIGGVPKCKIKSMVIDSDNNFSSLAEKSVLVDYTAPPKPQMVKLVPYNSNNCIGIAGELMGKLNGTWGTVSDANSNPVNYYYRISEIGQSGGNMKVCWEYAGANNSVCINSKLEAGKSYQLLVQARNQAGLVSATSLSPKFTVKGKIAGKIIFSSPSVKGCDNADSWNNIVDGTNCENPPDLLLYPNPAKNSVRLHGVESGSLVMIYTISGTLVRKKFLGEDGEIDVSDLPCGTYIVKVKNEAVRFVKF